MFVVLLASAIGSVIPVSAQINNSGQNQTQSSLNKSLQPEVVRQYINRNKTVNLRQNRFNYEPDLDSGKYTYIFELSEQAVAQNEMSLAQLRLNRMSNTRVSNNRVSSKNNVIKAQRQKINTQQQEFLNQASALLNANKVLARYEFALNGLALRVTQEQALQLSKLSMVKQVTREKIHKLQTDTGPTLIGAPEVWTANNLPTQLPNQGEGIIVGIIDSGINTDHPSFAEVAGDGYLHSNPLGHGNYLGDCAGLSPQLCNNKLIGVYSYPVITNVYSDTSVFPPNLPRNGEDYDGHGSHVAGTAAGNVLNNVNEVLPVLGEQENDGEPTGFVIEQLSGVAPRANIISYQVCYPGSSDDNDTYSNCVTSAILAAIDDAIADNVDVINFSISGGGNPWSDATERAFLNANNAGIFVAVSVGNSGPQGSTSEKSAPWYTSVAFSEHGRDNQFAKTITNFTGGTSSLADIPGQSNTGSYTGRIVYAGDFSNPNDPGRDPAQCFRPFPTGTFNGQIVVCDRGEIARVEKAENVAAGGAGGYILANVDGGETFLANDVYVIPGIHINAENGNRLKAWLRSGGNHNATITQAESIQVIDDSRIDVLARGSSRGPNEQISTLVPTLTAPGVDIYAAFADQQFGRDGDSEPAASDFNYLTGSSMSSPHVAGAAALVKSAHPSWSPDEIRSALSMTAVTNVKKEDGTTQADFFDMGAGRIQVDKAVTTGLIMNESNSDYLNANPSIGGDPRTLNLPSITDNECAVTCVWQRTFTATTNATWTFEDESISEGISITASPSTFTLLAGQQQTVMFTILNEIIDTQNYSFAIARFTSPGLPDIHIPISVLTTVGDFPREVAFDGRRDIDSILLNDLELIQVDDFSTTAYLPVKPIVVKGNIREDSNNDYSDNFNDGVSLTEVITPDNAIRLTVELISSTAFDVDLYVLFDQNEDGVVELDEEVARSQSSSNQETIVIDNPAQGSYFIAVHNFSGRNVTGDDFEMQYAVTTETLATDELFVEAPTSVNAYQPFDVRIGYNLPDSQENETYFAAVGLGNNSSDNNLGFMHIVINRQADDVSIEGVPVRIDPLENANFTISIKPNPTNEVRRYEIILPVPVGTEIVNYSNGFDAELSNNQVRWEVLQNPGSVNSVNLNVEIKALDGISPGPIDIFANSRLLDQSFSELEKTNPVDFIQVEGPPTISFSGTNQGVISVTETRQVEIPVTIVDPNNDSLNIVWTQTSGQTANILGSANNFFITAPRVESDTQLTYNVTATDPSGNVATGSLVVNVINNQSPIINSVSAPSSASGGQSINIVVNASDPENDRLTITLNGEVLLGSTANVRTPTTGSQATYTVTVSDGINTVNQTVTVELIQASSSGGGSLFWILWFIFPVAVYRVSRHIRC